jgi:hypothetical protein
VTVAVDVAMDVDVDVDVTVAGAGTGDWPVNFPFPEFGNGTRPDQPWNLYLGK